MFNQVNGELCGDFTKASTKHVDFEGVQNLVNYKGNGNLVTMQTYSI